MLVKRSDKVTFFGVKNGETVVFKRMTGFTELNTSKNPKEYNRQYVDEEFEQSDIVGYSPSMSFAFDKYSDNDIHKDLASISDNELCGDAAVRSLIIVDLTDGSDENGYKAVKRDFSVICDSEGNSMDAYTYSGNFKVKGEKVFGVAKSEDDWQTITFTEIEE